MKSNQSEQRVHLQSKNPPSPFMLTLAITKDYILPEPAQLHLQASVGLNRGGEVC